MSAAGCARAASDLTALVHRLDRARRALVGQSRLPEDDFGGLSGDAYRRHAAGSAVTVAGTASDLALLAGALAALGRSLAAAEEIRDLAAASPPERARELRLRARDLENHAQQRWRVAVASYDGRPGPAPVQPMQPMQPIVPVQPVQPVMPGTLLGPSPSSAPEPAVPPSVGGPAPAPTPVASVAAAPAVPTDAEPEPVLDSALVTPPPALESELVDPATEPARCGTPEVLDELR